jgi:N-methylhydantoinase B
VNDARYGFDCLEYTFNDESGGHGEFRGGKGVTIRYRMRSDASLVGVYSRSVGARAGFSEGAFYPWGTRGGHNGTPNYMRVAEGGTDGGVPERKST